MLVAFCVCEHCPNMCLHTWIPVLDELEATSNKGRLGGYNPASWTADLRAFLTAIGVQDVECWFGHDVRRGAAGDVLAAHGISTMLDRGGWRSVQSSRPYVPREEMDAALLAQGIIDDSGPES